MKIDPENPPPAVPSPQETKAAPAASKRASRGAHPPAPTDLVQLSPKTKTLLQALQVVSETQEVRDAKVQELQQAVERGTYHVTAEQLAEKILQETLRETLS